MIARAKKDGQPDAAEIIERRQAAGLTQTEAAELIGGSLRSWQEWEGATAYMHPGLWELFCSKTARVIKLRERRHAK